MLCAYSRRSLEGGRGAQKEAGAPRRHPQGSAREVATSADRRSLRLNTAITGIRWATGVPNLRPLAHRCLADSQYGQTKQKEGAQEELRGTERVKEHPIVSTDQRWQEGQAGKAVRQSLEAECLVSSSAEHREDEGRKRTRSRLPPRSVRIALSRRTT